MLKSGMLEIRAGKRAYEHIMANGLSADDIHTVFGASGAAKWLSIAGLDSAIFGDWLSGTTHTINLFGTSIGAIKLAAAVQPLPKERLAALADAYIAQRYQGRPTPDEIKAQGDGIMEAALGEDGVNNLLHHARYRYHCGAVQSTGRMVSERRADQIASMSFLALQNFRGKEQMARGLKRVIISTPCNQTDTGIRSNDGVDTLYLALNEKNLRDAVRASGSIPVYMHGVEWPSDSTTQTTEPLILRDGGLLDYHPSPSNFSTEGSGFVLYPHFFGKLVETWFDKFIPWRQVRAESNQDMILLFPGEHYLNSIELGRVPDRADFNRFSGKDAERERLWRQAYEMSYRLGEEWLEISERQSWESVVKPL